MLNLKFASVKKWTKSDSLTRRLYLKDGRIYCDVVSWFVDCSFEVWRLTVTILVFYNWT